MADGVAWETVRRAAGGDADARRSLVEATVDNLWALAMRMVRRRDDADEITQETYARLFAGIGGLTPTGRFEGYLARIATNLVLERWRRKRPTADLADFDVSAAGDMEPWQAVAKSEDQKRRLAAIWEAVEDLEGEPRAAFLLYYAQEEPCDEIARILDVPVGTVKTWLYRARNHVRQRAEARLVRQR
jgi:RNA polymerase sigma-70 factor (ECF subfamily)